MIIEYPNSDKILHSLASLEPASGININLRLGISPSGGKSLI